MEEPKDFGGGRFIVRRELGAGGMGMVYEAHDVQTDVVVALKTLARLSATSLYLFKNEFRSLADLSHPNLVSLFELFRDEELWFFTMDVVRGRDFLTYVRAGPGRRPPGGEDTKTTVQAARDGEPAAAAAPTLLAPTLLSRDPTPPLQPTAAALPLPVASTPASRSRAANPPRASPPGRGPSMKRACERRSRRSRWGS